MQLIVNELIVIYVGLQLLPWSSSVPNSHLQSPQLPQEPPWHDNHSSIHTTDDATEHIFLTSLLKWTLNSTNPINP